MKLLSQYVSLFFMFLDVLHVSLFHFGLRFLVIPPSCLRGRKKPLATGVINDKDTMTCVVKDDICFCNERCQAITVQHDIHKSHERSSDTGTHQIRILVTQTKRFHCAWISSLTAASSKWSLHKTSLEQKQIQRHYVFSHCEASLDPLLCLSAACQYHVQSKGLVNTTWLQF